MGRTGWFASLALALLLSGSLTLCHAQGLFQVVALESRTWTSNVDGAAFPSVDPAFARQGVSEAFDTFYRTSIAGAGYNSLVVAVSPWDDAEATATKLANLGSWAAGVGAPAPHLIVNLTDLDKAESLTQVAGTIEALVKALATKLKPAEGAEATTYRRIAAYRLGPALNLLAAKGGAVADPMSLALMVRAAIGAAERSVLGAAFTPTPVQAAVSMDYALLSRGKIAPGDLAAEDLDAAYGDLRPTIDATIAGRAVDCVVLQWHAGSLSPGTPDQMTQTLQRLATDYPANQILLDTGYSTAFNTHTQQSEWGLSLLASVASGLAQTTNFAGFSWSCDVDSAAPEPPDADVADRVAAWTGQDAGPKVAAALWNPEADADARWWVGRVEAAMGINALDAAGAPAPKPVATALQDLAAKGVGIAQLPPAATTETPTTTPTEAPTGTATEAPGTAPAEGPADLAVTGLALVRGTIQPNQEVVLKATISNPSAAEVPNAAVSFVYGTAGTQDWQLANATPVMTTIPAGGQVEVEAPAWVVPEGVVEVGAWVSREGVTEANEQNNLLSATPESLAGGAPVVASTEGQPVTGEGQPAGTTPEGTGGYVATEEDKPGIVEKLVSAVGQYLISQVGGPAGGILQSVFGEQLGMAPGTTIPGATASTESGGYYTGGTTTTGTGGTTGTTGTAGDVVDVGVTQLALSSGTFAAGQSVVIAATVANSALATDLPQVQVDFSYTVDGANWQFITAEPLLTAVARSAQVTVPCPAWTVPAGVQQVGVTVALSTGADANASNDALAVTAADLAGGGVSTAAAGGTTTGTTGETTTGTGTTTGGTGTTTGGTTGTTTGGTGTTTTGTTGEGTGTTTTTGGTTPAVAASSDVSVTALKIASGQLQEGQQVTIAASLHNPSAEGAVNDLLVDFSYLLAGGTEWQFTHDAAVAASVPASGNADAVTPPWTVPANLASLGV
ncbi:hypothetical protein LLH03_15375, partial [bacterium]|nr:hypothetical protein [bacterium]